MDFDDLVATVVPADFLSDVRDILVASGFVSALASQAWDLQGVDVDCVLGLSSRPSSRRRRRRFVLLTISDVDFRFDCFGNFVLTKLSSGHLWPIEDKRFRNIF